MQMGTNIAEILNFYKEAGVDEVINDDPTDHFALSAAPPKQKVATPYSPAPSPASAAPSSPQPTSAPSINLAAEIKKAEALAQSANNLEQLKEKLDQFTGSSLKSMAISTVFARGNPAANLMIIDRTPGAEEDRQGQPFAAQKGGLLEKMLKAIGLEMDMVYLAAALPWRPPGGQAPSREDKSLCLPFLKRHIELVDPQVLLLCGEAAAILLEKDKVGVNKLRGKWEIIKVGNKEIPTLSIFHPAFLMDHPASKKLAWKDLLALKAHLNNIPH